MKLNKRLLALSKMVNKPYQVVWDCCCDHGLLGFKILADGLVKQVNFVDVVPDIIEQLKQRLASYGHHLPADTYWQTFCQDVSTLTFSEDSQSNLTTRNTQQLVIISGVGGELMIDMLTTLMQRYAGYNIDYLLCPVQHTYKLRSELIRLKFKLQHEQLVIENNRGYELLLVNQQGLSELSVTGCELWQHNDQHQQYLHKLIRHYQRIVESGRGECSLEKSALDDYQTVYRAYYHT